MIRSFSLDIRLYLAMALLGFLVFFFVKGKPSKKAEAGLLSAYLFFFLVNTVFLRQTDRATGLNLSLFWTYQAMLAGGGRGRRMVAQLIINILITVPIGALLPVVWEKCNLRKALLFGLAFSILNEVLQFFLRKGLCELDDVFHNVLGVLIGYGIYAGITAMYNVPVKLDQQ